MTSLGLWRQGETGKISRNGEVLQWRGMVFSGKIRRECEEKGSHWTSRTGLNAY